jgi:hypothetical protein
MTVASDAKTVEGQGVPGLTEEGYDHTIGGLIGVRLLLRYAMEGLQAEHDKLRDARHAAPSPAGAEGELAARVDEWLSRFRSGKCNCDECTLFRDIRATVLSPQAAEDRAVGAAVRELDAIPGIWGRFAFGSGDGPFWWMPEYNELVKPDTKAWSLQGLLANVRARLAPPVSGEEQPASSPAAPTVPPEVAEKLLAAGATVGEEDGCLCVFYAMKPARWRWTRPAEVPTQEDWDYLVSQAQRHDNRPALREWCERNGGSEEAAVLAECRNRGWGFEYAPTESHGRFYGVGWDDGDEPWDDYCDTASDALAAACAAAKVPTPWGPGKPEADGGWPVPTGRAGKLAWLNERDEDALQVACLAAHYHEEEAAHADAS